MLVVLIAILNSRASLSKIDPLNTITLRSLHHFNFDRHGKTSIGVNSSERFFNLYDALSSEELSEISAGVENAYNYPYLSVAKLEQSFVYKNHLVEVRMHDLLIAELNNPVFPSMKLFNLRSDSISVQKMWKRGEFKVVPRISLMNRWYINRSISLEEIVTDDLELDLKEGRTYVPLYLDLFAEKKLMGLIVSTYLTSLDLFDSDKYDYADLFLEISKPMGSKINLGVGLSPLYQGEYDLVDSVVLGGEYRAYHFLKFKLQVSQLQQSLGLNLKFQHFEGQLRAEKTKKSQIEDKYTNNISLGFSIRY